MRIFAFLLLLIIPATAFPCTFINTAEFCPLARSLESRAGVNHAVVHFIGEDIIYDQRSDGAYYAPIYRVRVLNTLYGHFRAGDVIYLWTGDDWDCNGPVDYIEPGQEYVIGFPDSLTDQTIVSELTPNAPQPLYNLWGWGALVYPVRSTPTGTIINTLEYGEQSLTEFSKSIDKCHPEQPDIDLTLYPNPTVDQLTITSTEVSIKTVEIYDQRARFLSQHQYTPMTTDEVSLSVGHLPAGIYHVIVRTGIGSYYRRIVKR
ncbi:MAG: hypothetical protein ACI81P_003356 [Neolewinella sp.]|jgi:hypothetical protein